MDPISTLRQQAAAKRDAAILKAKADYSYALRLLDDLAKTLPNESRKPRIGRRSQQQPVIELLADILPKDRPFTIRDVLGLLRAAHPSREFHEPTIRTFFAKLIDRGMIRRLRKLDKGFIQWAAAGYAAPDDGPLSALSMPDAVETVLRERGPLRPAELVVAIQEQGYRSDANPRALLTSLKQAHKRNADRFSIGADGTWQSV
jgi:hypothetical protein